MSQPHGCLWVSLWVGGCGDANPNPYPQAPTPTTHGRCPTPMQITTTHWLGCESWCHIGHSLFCSVGHDWLCSYQVPGRSLHWCSTQCLGKTRGFQGSGYPGMVLSSMYTHRSRTISNTIVKPIEICHRNHVARLQRKAPSSCKSYWTL